MAKFLVILISVTSSFAYAAPFAECKLWSYVSGENFGPNQILELGQHLKVNIKNKTFSTAKEEDKASSVDEVMMYVRPIPVNQIIISNGQALAIGAPDVTLGLVSDGTDISLTCKRL